VSVFLSGILLLLMVCAVSCRTTVRDADAWNSWATNSYATWRRDLAPFVPAPLNAAVEILLASGTAALAVWVRRLHRRVNGKGSPPPAENEGQPSIAAPENRTSS
jgi:hypothetical protein